VSDEKRAAIDAAIARTAAAAEPIVGQVPLEGGRFAVIQLPRPLFAQDVVRITQALGEIWSQMPREPLPSETGQKPSPTSRLVLPS
jgi:hypothetical protein